MDRLTDIFGFQNPIKISSDVDFPEARKVFEELSRLGFKSPILYGGALRDFYLGKDFRDLDISLNTDDIFSECPTIEQIRSWVDQNLPHYNLNPGLGFTTQGIKTITDPKTYCHFESSDTHNGTKLDLAFETPQRDLNTIIFHADCTLDSIAMDKNGNLYAHPLFEKHAEQMLYVPLKTLEHRNNKTLEQRFNKVHLKHPHLKICFPEYLPTDLLPDDKGLMWKKTLEVRAKISQKMDDILHSFVHE